MLGSFTLYVAVAAPHTKRGWTIVCAWLVIAGMSGLSWWMDRRRFRWWRQRP